jgi:hypothetical protein
MAAKSRVIAVLFLVLCVALADAGDRDELPASFDVLQQPENTARLGYGCFTKVLRRLLCSRVHRRLL